MISERTVRALDQIQAMCEEHSTPAFRSWLRVRSARTPRRIPATETIMRKIGYAIAYSRQARSDLVGPLITSGALDEAFLSFDHKRLARVKATNILSRHWKRIGCIRQKSKVSAILKAAAILSTIEKECGSFATYLHSFAIPRRIHSGSDINAFWLEFERLQSDLKRRQMPFFRQTTSLLQLLLDLDFDSVKPDLIIMRLARRIGLVEREVGERHLREAVWSLQAYSVLRGIRAAAMDWYLLSFGGQKEASESLRRRFCPSNGKCNANACAVGDKRLCTDYTG